MNFIEVIEDTTPNNTALSAMGEVLLNAAKPPVTIKVVGVGGGGGNAVTHMIRAGIKNVTYITVNTDSQALYKTPADIKIQLGENGQGAGANPNVARAYAEAARPQLMEALKGADMVFITAGLGKGTGTGASAVVAQVAKEIGALTVCVVTKPFTSEGPMRAKIADAAADELGLHSDSLITVLNSKLESSNPDGLMKEWYYAADDVLKSAVSTIVEIIQSSGYQNVDFRDVVSVMGSNRGRALMGTARATGPERAKQAAMQAVRSDLLEEENLRTARGVLINITAAEDSMRGREITEIIDTIRSHCSDDVTPIYGTTFDDRMGEDLQVTVIVSGIGARNKVSLAANLPEVNRAQASTTVGQQAYLTPAIGQAAIVAEDAQQSPALFSYRTGTDDVTYTMPISNELIGQSMPLNLDSPNSAIPTLTQEVMAPSTSLGNNHSIFDAGSLMLNPSSMHNPKTDMQNRVKAMQTQGIPTLEIPTFLRNQVN
jgi:cell division protein FtsZ